MARAGDRDRERYLDHLDVLYQDGYIRSDLELDEYRDRVSRARSMGDLDRVITGMPLPSTPKEPRDWGIPRNWGPLFISTGFAGVCTAVLVPVALANSHSTPANLIVALSMIVGIILIVLSVIGATVAAFCWDDQSEEMKRERRARDPGW